jgi:hypothetical protein
LLIEEKTISFHAKEANIIQVNDPDLKYGTVNVFAEKINITDKPPVAKITDVKFDYILGNPPFIGKHLQNPVQKSDLELIFNGVNGAGVLDYVTAWYIKAAKYLKEYNIEEIGNDRKTRVAFVSTNSIAQGEQVGILWNELFNHYHIKIHFAHRTFKWGNEARANASVHVVMIGFSNFDIPEKRIFEYENSNSEPHELKVKNINPYLVEGNDTFILSRTKPINTVQPIVAGNKAIDGGNLIFTDIEKDEFIKLEPKSDKFFRQFIGSEEFINSKSRWCLWLVDVEPKELKNMPFVLERIRNVKELREKSTDKQARMLANYPSTFRDKQNPENALIIPLVSSESRKYIPFGFIDKNTIPSNLCSFISNATNYHFGILTSLMHMTWVKYVCGRLESRYRYSNAIVYNNFPWPENPGEKQRESIETAAQKVLDVRAGFQNPSPSGRSGGASLADLYNPLTMPHALVKAHNELDKAVDLAYRPQPFINETKRIEYLFELYDKYTAGLFPAEKKKGKK